MKIVLITGSEGFVGSHLVDILQEDLYKVVPTCYPLLMPKNRTCIPLDILNRELTAEVVKNHKPDIIVHLAAISSVSKSFRDPPLTYSTNVLGTAHMLEAARGLKKRIKFIYVSSCEVYGGGEDLKEDADVKLVNAYAVSKYSAELVCNNYALEKNIECVILRPFTHTGQGQSPDFVLPTIATQIVDIEKNKKPPLIELGNVEARREFINVKDIVHAYKLAVEKCKGSMTYNISSGQGYTIAHALEIFRKYSKVKFEVKIDPERVRKTDIPSLIGNGRKFAKLTGWKPRVPFTKTIEDLLNYWRAMK
jgi:GDP-4-dehydro-6-deoxy-D-mannose reductase